MARPWERVIVHADLDAFFATAEIRRSPELRGKPVIVGGRPGRRGVVAAASYEARVYGIRSAMPVAQAARLCPHAVFLPGDGQYYRELSRQFRAILERFSPLVEMVSIDEAYLDLSHSERIFGTPLDAAHLLKQQVRTELDLVVSLGVASNRLVAKIASDLDKPDGLRVVTPGTEASFLAPLSVERMPGIGPKATAHLHRLGVRTLGELSALPASLLRPIFGRRTPAVIDRARGIDHRPVEPDGEPAKSIGHERTFGHDLTDPTEIEHALAELSQRVGRDLRRAERQGRVVTVKLRYADFETVSRQRRIRWPTNDQREISHIATALTEEILTQRRAPVRLLGVRVAALVPTAIQLTLFDDAPLRRQQLNAALDQIAGQYGPNLVLPGRLHPVQPNQSRISVH